MKKFVLFLMCAAAFTFAQTDEEVEPQEEESTQVEETEEAEEVVPSAVGQSETVDYYAVDSLKIYNDLADKFDRRGQKLRRPATPLIVAGSIALGVGLITAIVGEVMIASSCDSYDDNCDDSAVGGAGLFIFGDLLATAGGLSLATGITLKIVGGTQLRRANMYHKKAEDFERRSAYLRVVPTVDPVNGRVGTLAMINF